MTALRRHIIAVVAALFALAVGIALGGGPLSYGSDEDTSSTASAPEPDDEQSTAEPADAEPDGFADAFAAAAAAKLYDQALLGHPTAIVAMPGVDQAVLDGMVAQVKAAGGGLTGVFVVSPDAVDRSKAAEVDSQTGTLMTNLGDARIDPEATTYTRLGQLLSLAVATPAKHGQRSNISSDAVRAGLGSAGLLTADPAARLAPLVLVLLPASAERDDDEALAETAIQTGLATGLRVNAAGVVVLGDRESGMDGLLADMRDDPLVTSTVATVDGADTAIGQVTAMLAVIGALDGSVGAYGASGADGAVPIS